MDDPTLFDTKPFTNGSSPPPNPHIEEHLCYHSWRLSFDDSEELVSQCQWCALDRPLDPQRDRAKLEQFAQDLTWRLNGCLKKLEKCQLGEERTRKQQTVTLLEERLAKIEKRLEPSPSNQDSNRNYPFEPATVESFIQSAEHWKEEEIEDAIAALSALLDVKQEAMEKGKGSIEEKFITKVNSKGQQVKHGPYRYLRYYNNGKKKSKYLGKK